MKKKISAILLLAFPLYAVQDCTTLDGSPYTQDQRNLVPALAYEIGFANDNTVQPPTVNTNGSLITICFTNPSFLTSVIITTTTLVNQYNIDQAARAVAAAQINAWRVELSTTLVAGESAYASWATLNQAQINNVVKGLLRENIILLKLLQAVSY